MTYNFGGAEQSDYNVCATKLTEASLNSSPLRGFDIGQCLAQIQPPETIIASECVCHSVNVFTKSHMTR